MILINDIVFSVQDACLSWFSHRKEDTKLMGIQTVMFSLVTVQSPCTFSFVLVILCCSSRIINFLVCFSVKFRVQHWNIQKYAHIFSTRAWIKRNNSSPFESWETEVSPEWPLTRGTGFSGWNFRIWFFRYGDYFRSTSSFGWAATGQKCWDFSLCLGLS